MRIDLSKVASERLDVTWPAPHGVQSVVLGGATDLQGRYESGEGGFQVSRAACARLLVEALSLRFGALLIDLAEGGLLEQVDAALDKQEALTLSIVARGLTARELTITAEGFAVTALVEAQAVRLSVDGGDGELSADVCTLQQTRLRAGGLALESSRVIVTNLNVRWGASGLSFSAESASAPELQLAHALGLVRVLGLRVERLTRVGETLEIAGAHSERVELDGRLPQPSATPTASGRETKAPSVTPLLDARMLDGLSGYLNVDVEVDLSVPVLGHRRATHKLRVPIADGAINYRALEHDLASLEDSLLDFSVREGALVLERGLPLLSTRGRGKPLLVWSLSPVDLELAEAHRVRLAVLPEVRVVTDDGSSEARDRPSKFQLRTISFQRIDAELALRPIDDVQAVLRALAFARLRVTGHVHHEAGPPDPPGKLAFVLDGFSAHLAALALGSSRMDAAVGVRSLHDLELDFVDLRPARLRGSLQDLTIARVALKPSA